ncbi:caspase family protein [Bradyrhizobium elkanii]|uniref:caspase family protein n=1 Tax=Bradyrhizobium elkanii TaxID=29448 RepID=UPI002711DA14|nr:caspase family protein [Bradyrhizobium elkanii]WLA39747.1 caspase family protein [Bradyrhizobium elkanii]
MRKALVVGIDHYEHIGNLSGCVNDAHSVKAMLERHADGSVNFGTKIVVGTGPADILTRAELKEAVRELFADDSEVALFYFAGHGYIEATGGYLCAGDCRTGDDGLPLAEIMSLANDSPARNKIIILDSCHSGAIGDSHTNKQISEIAEGMTILTASTKGQYATEKNGGGLFTGLLVDALGGAAANVIGEVTPGSVYAHIDQSLGSWSQRPVFKTNVKTFVSLRQIQPPLPLADLQRIAEFFPTPGFEFQLDPGFEPEHPSADPAKTPILAILQKYNRMNLAVPVGTIHPYHAAIESKTMKLTALGEHYRRLVVEGLL